jgi:hypothetical protein
VAPAPGRPGASRSRPPHAATCRWCSTGWGHQKVDDWLRAHTVAELVNLEPLQILAHLKSKPCFLSHRRIERFATGLCALLRRAGFAFILISVLGVAAREGTGNWIEDVIVALLGALAVSWSGYRILKWFRKKGWL